MKDFAPILITGMPRSGTSMIAASINHCGVFAGRMSKRGRYSNDQIRLGMVQPYLSRMGVDVEGHYPLLEKKVIPLDWKSKIDNMMVFEGYNKYRGPWMYKDSRLCLMWPVWNYAYPNAKWVIVRRKTSDVINSCMKTGYMTTFKNEEIYGELGITSEKEGWLWMVREYEKRFVTMIQEGLNCKVIWPERMVQGDYQQMRELLDWLGLQWKDEVLNYINPLLWGSKLERKVI
jgi:hypothetical protein